jgi:uncharacterized protein (TIGR02271 family)
MIMQHTLVAVFDNRSDAQNAMDELLASGFDRSDVNVSSADPTGQTSSLSGDVPAATDDTHAYGVGHSIGHSIRHFFTSLFGSDNDEHVQRYSDVVARGHHVLTLTTESEPEVERAADVIERFGPIDLDERHDLTGSAASLDPAMLAAGASSGSGLQKSSSMSSQSGSLGSMQQGTQPGALQGGADEDRNFFATQNINDPVPKDTTFQEPMGASMQSGGSLDSATGGNTLSGTQSSSLDSGLSNSRQTAQGGSLSQSDSVLQGTRSLQGSEDASLGGTIQSGQSMQRDTTQTSSLTGKQQRDSAAIPVVEEQLKVGKREVNRGGVRVFSRVVETPVNESVNLREEHVNVQRRPVDQPISTSDSTAFKEQSIELRESAEEAVVQKSARVVEEVVVGKEVSQRQEQINDTVRRTEVQVENLPGDTGSPDRSMRASGSSLDDDTYFRNDWQSNYASGGGSYDDYQPAYRYGSEARSKYQGRDWSDVESDLRSDWDTRYGKSGASTWEKFKNAVRRGWDKVTPDMDDSDSAYRSHWNSTYGASGDSYDDYEPAYRYGNEMRSSAKYRGRNWDDVESDLRSDWDTRNTRGGPSTWDKMKAAVRHGWDRMTD